MAWRKSPRSAPEAGEPGVAEERNRKGLGRQRRRAARRWYTGTQGAPTDVPVAVSDLSEVTAISAGEANSLALLKSGSVKALGWNEWGQLGDGTTISRNDPLSVVGLSEVTAIATGGQFSLGVARLGKSRRSGNSRTQWTSSWRDPGYDQRIELHWSHSGPLRPEPGNELHNQLRLLDHRDRAGPAEDPTEVPVTVSTSAGTSQHPPGSPRYGNDTLRARKVLRVRPNCDQSRNPEHKDHGEGDDQSPKVKLEIPLSFRSNRR